MHNRLHTNKHRKINPYYGFPVIETTIEPYRIRTEPNTTKHQSKCIPNKSTFDEYRQSFKDISSFRDVMPDTNIGYLPFLNSLRKMHQAKPHDSSVIPFNVAAKETCNTQTKKRVCDFNNGNKIAEMYTMWNRNGSVQNKTIVNFQSALRGYQSRQSIPTRKQFNYLRTQIETSIPLEYTFDQKNVSCNRFARLYKSVEK